jgi:hypothetical protein
VCLRSGEKLRLDGEEPIAVFPVRSVLCLQFPHSDGSAVSFASVGAKVAWVSTCWRPRRRARRRPSPSGPGLPAAAVDFARNSSATMSSPGRCSRAATPCSRTRRYSAPATAGNALDQQLARWLLVMLDRMPGNELVVTQEMIASLLGVRREGVTEAAADCSARA